MEIWISPISHMMWLCCSGTFHHLLPASGIFCHLLSPSIIFPHLPSPSITFCHVLPGSGTFYHLLECSITFFYLLLLTSSSGGYTRLCHQNLLVHSITFLWLYIPYI
ncbi:hypothetical protein DL96DRAFT_221438 [Flagelloscypha sp. PMI_526]|nr:hypothetical protein DL96DRAFT_221438 [Flagelloscypha sp. PMI_526]